jgi:U32 family peptidase
MQMLNNHKPEILSPAGNLERLEYAVAYGADAVYIGGKDFSLRAKASNFTLDDINEGVRITHSAGKKLYVTLNIFGRDNDFDKLSDYVGNLAEIGVDSVIVADPGIFTVVKKVAPNIRIHISTQANVTNTAAADFWYAQGASRVVLARELSAGEIHDISKNSEIETEAFIHGAMCIAYSGRCLMSKFLANRDGNRGDCSHTCRWNYRLVEEKRPGLYHDVEEDKRGLYLFNSKDLSLINHIPELMRCGLRSLKIEGRMKSTHYVAAMTKIYRQAVDRYHSDPENYSLDPEWLNEIEKVSHRLYSTGFFLGEKGEEIIDCSRYEKTHDFVALVKGYDEKNKKVILEVRNRLKLNDVVEVLSPNENSREVKITSMLKLNPDQYSGEIVGAAHAGSMVALSSDEPWHPNAIVRRAVDKKVID